MDQRIIENGKKIPKLRHVSVQLDDAAYLQLNRLALVAHRNVAFVIRGIVMTYLEDHPVQLPSPPSDQEAVDE